MVLFTLVSLFIVVAMAVGIGLAAIEFFLNPSLQFAKTKMVMHRWRLFISDCAYNIRSKFAKKESCDHYVHVIRLR